MVTVQGKNFGLEVFYNDGLTFCMCLKVNKGHDKI